jgi:hypothetical protein
MPKLHADHLYLEGIAQAYKVLVLPPRGAHPMPANQEIVVTRRPGNRKMSKASQAEHRVRARVIPAVPGISLHSGRTLTFALSESHERLGRCRDSR